MYLTLYFQVDAVFCIPRSLWLLVRHGSRNPGDDSIEEGNELLPKIRDRVARSNATKMCQEDKVLTFSINIKPKNNFLQLIFSTCFVLF